MVSRGGDRAPGTADQRVRSSEPAASGRERSTVNGQRQTGAAGADILLLFPLISCPLLFTPHSSLVVQGGAGCGQQHVGIESYLVIGICILELDDAVSVHDESGRDREQVMGFS